VPVFKVVFSNEAAPTASAAPPDFSFNVAAASADDALGLAEIKFAQKHPQKLRSHYCAHLAAHGADPGGSVQHFERTAPLNPDQ
jgi:hypothetical protein